MSNCENFVKFANFFKIFNYYKEEKPNMTKSLYGFEGFKDDSAKNFRLNIEKGIKNCKIFEIEDSIKRLLILTKTPINNEELYYPFDTIFLDVNFTKEELKEYGIDIIAEEIIGILFTKGSLVREDGFEVGEDLNITMLSKNFFVDKEYPLWFDSFNKRPNLKDEYKNYKFKIYDNPTTDKNAKEFIYRFVLNFINFVNNPEIEIIENKRSEKNQERRIKRGLPIIPSSSTIILTGKLKYYVQEIQNNPSWHYNYRFWVKGFFRNLRSDKYKEKKRIWLMPFIKGKGILIEKTYILRRNEK